VRVLKRRAFTVACAGASLVPGACFDRPYYERNDKQKAFLDGLMALTKPALESNNPLKVEDAARRSLALAAQVGAFADWYGILRTIEGNAQTVAITIEIGPQISLFAFNDWALAMAGSLAEFFSTRSRESAPPGLSDQAIAALKVLNLGQHVKLSGRMGEIAGSGLFDLGRLFGKSDADNRQFLQVPRFVARIVALVSAND